MTHSPAFVATIALCGGTSRRMGVPDKTALPFGEATILDSALAGLPTGLVVCVGDPRPLRAPTPTVQVHGAPAPAAPADPLPLVWTRETPVGGGPVAGIRAGLDAVFAEFGAPRRRHTPPAPTGPLGEHAEATTAAGPPEDDPFTHTEPLVAVIAGDQPFAGRVVPRLVPALARRLRDTSPLDATPDGVAVAAPGRGGPSLLLAVYRLRALDAAIGDDVIDRGVYQTLRGLNVSVLDSERAEWQVDTDVLSLDVDDPDDLSRALAVLARLR